MRPLQENKNMEWGVTIMYWEINNNKGQGVRERRRGEKCSYVFQSLRTERAAVSMSGIPPAVEAT